MDASPPPSHDNVSGTRNTVYVLLADRARKTVAWRLIAYATIGAAGATILLLLVPALWMLAVPLIFVAAFGGWGLADLSAREFATTAQSSPFRQSSLMIIKMTLAIIGTLAVAASILIAFLLVISPMRGLSG